MLKVVKLEFVLHLKKPHLWWGGLLYLAGVIFITYLNFNGFISSPRTWNALFWIIHLFLAIQLGNKTLQMQQAGIFYFLYQTVSPEKIILGRILYSFLELLLFTLLGFSLYLFYFPASIPSPSMLLILFLSGNLGLSVIITFTGSLSSGTRNAGMLSAILSFPVVLPILLMETRLTKYALDGLDITAASDESIILLAIAAIGMALSVILYPIVWKS